MQNNLTYGLTAEDIEKAASVRLFEKAASAEGINLADMSESQVDELYSAYQSQSEDNTMNEEIIDLFEKQAAYEGVDLESLNDEELAYVYNNFVNNLAELEEGAEEEEEEYDADEEAYEKLAEAEILGRHMARAYMDEMEKEAKKSYGQKVKDFTGISDIQEGRKQKASAKELAGKAEEMRGKIKAGGQSKKMKAAQGKIVAKRSKASSEAAAAGSKAMKAGGKKMLRAGGLGVGGLLAAKGVSSMMKKEAAFEELLEGRMQEYVEFGKEAGFSGSHLDNIALERLTELGYDITPVIEDYLD